MVAYFDASFFLKFQWLKSNFFSASKTEVIKDIQEDKQQINRYAHEY